jgi:cytochrome b6-f complex iron-sulfur subunit
MTRTAAGVCATPCGELIEPAEGIGRRTFLVQTALLTAAAALAACGADLSSPNIPAGTTVNVNNYASLASVGGVALVTVSGAALAIVRTGATTFVALSRVCPHEGGIVNQSGSGFLCPVHGAQFTATGTWQGGQRTSSLHSYATSYDSASGILTIG